MRSLICMLALGVAACLEAPARVAADAATPDAAVTATPVRCDGALCDTTNGSTCDAGSGSPGSMLAIAVVLLAIRRRRPAVAVIGWLGAALATVRVATAEPEPAVNVKIAKPPEIQRNFSITLNPLAFVAIGKLSADLVFVPKNHHAIVFNPFYTWNTTAPIYVFAPDSTGTIQPVQLPQQRFRGPGAELGYRYYYGDHGPRGLFLGASFVVAWMFEHQEMFGDGSKTKYVDLGLAGDVGYQVLVKDKISLGVGVGVQGLWTAGRSIPPQQFPTNIYANSGIWPRLLFSAGWAL